MTTTDTTNRFADPTVTAKLEQLVRNAPTIRDCPVCKYGNTWRCPRCISVAIVAAMRAQELVVLTSETADEILAHQRRTVTEEIGEAIERELVCPCAEYEPDESKRHQVCRWGGMAADIARKHREEPK